MNKLLIWYLLGLLSANIIAKPIQGDLLVLSTVYDEYITVNNPKLRGMIIIAKTLKDCQVQISYRGYDGMVLAKRVGNILEGYTVQYIVLENDNQIEGNVNLQIFQDE